MPTCPPLYVALLQSLGGFLFDCLLTQPRAKGYLHVRDGAGSVFVDRRCSVCETAYAAWGGAAERRLGYWVGRRMTALWKSHTADKWQSGCVDV